MLILNIDRSVSVPVYKQISDGIKSLISSSALNVGDKLPPSRKLADQLGINRTTVMRAYDDLWAEGYIESRSGSYSTVRKRRTLAIDSPTMEQSKVDWYSKFTDDTSHALERYFNRVEDKKDDDCISFLDLSPDNAIMPVELLKKTMNSVLKEKPFLALQYGKPEGYRGLRESICNQMRKHCISVGQDEIIITNGAQNGIDLVCRALVKPRDIILVEEPGYSMAHPLFAFSGAQVIGVPMINEGVSLEMLEQRIVENRPAFFYTMPNFHNPTGITTSQEHREKLIGLCEQYKVPIVEDGFEEEMKYFGKAVLPLKSMDKNGLVIYIGTFSKVLFPGLRIGWIAANNQVIKALTAIKQTVDLSGNYLSQVAIDEFIRQGYYELHLRRLHKMYRKRMHAALTTLSKLDISEKVVFSKPQGGYLIYGELKDKQITEEQLTEASKKQGVYITAGSRFYSNPYNRACFRLSIAHLDEAKIKEGLFRLDKAINKL